MFKGYLIALTIFVSLIVPASVYGQVRAVDQLQRELTLLGYAPGPIDGLWGPKTAAALNEALPSEDIDSWQNLSLLHKLSLVDEFNRQWENREAAVPYLQQPMSVADARHLLDRSGIGAHPSEINDLVGLTRSHAVSVIISQLDVSFPTLPQPSWVDGPYVNYSQRWDYENEDRQAFEIARDKEMGEFRLWWVREMLSTSRPAGERLLLTWHNLFATQYSSLEQEALPIVNQHNMFRKFGASNFRLILQEIVRDAAMLNYLDNNNNRRDGPNENLARELMELFVLGEGNYTEIDVKEVARALTGNGYNELRSFEFEFAPWHHDSGSKTILGERGSFKADDVIDILLDQPAAAEFITGRFWKVYISEFNSNPEEIERISKDWIESDYDIKTLMRLTLTSSAFWAPENRASIVKTPVDLIIGTIRTSGVLPGWWQAIPSRLAGLGQHLFEPPNVAGWPGGVAWISPSRLQARAQILSDFDGMKPFIQDHTMEDMGMAVQNFHEMGGDMDLKTIRVRYGSEDFEGAPEFFIEAFADVDGRSRSVWRSEKIIAQNGWDTSRFGRVDSLADLNWQLLSLPFDGSSELPDMFRIVYSNDHCCGPGGSDGGDRNLFIDWLQVGSDVYFAADGEQVTCSRGNATPGEMYCSGILFLKEPISLTASNEVDGRGGLGLAVDRVSYNWGSRNRPQNIQFELSEIRYGQLRINAMQLEIQRGNYNGTRDYALHIRENRCFPDCFDFRWPTSSNIRDDGKREVEFPLNYRSSNRSESQYYELGAQQRNFVNALWAAIPDIYEASKQGRNARRRLNENMLAMWDPVFENISDTLPRTRYKSQDTRPTLTILSSRTQNVEMGMMMGISSGDLCFLCGIEENPNWQTQEPQMVNDLSLSRFIASAESQSSYRTFSELIRDARFQLK